MWSSLWWSKRSRILAGRALSIDHTVPGYPNEVSHRYLGWAWHVPGTRVRVYVRVPVPVPPGFPYSTRVPRAGPGTGSWAYPQVPGDRVPVAYGYRVLLLQQYGVYTVPPSILYASSASPIPGIGTGAGELLLSYCRLHCTYVVEHSSPWPDSARREV